MNFIQEKGPNVPEINDAVLDRLMRRFVPLVLCGNRICAIEIPDPRQTAFTWDPTFLNEVDFTPVREVKTDHNCAYHGYLKPSIAEVLAQVPDDLPEQCNAFYIDIDSVEVYRSGGGHRVTTIFGVMK